MKKFFALLLAAMMVFVFVSCGDTQGDETTNPSDATETTDTTGPADTTNTTDCLFWEKPGLSFAAEGV